MNLTVDIKTLKPVGFEIPLVSTKLNLTDTWGANKVRWGIGRDRYLVNPGLYKVGFPTAESDVFVSANYKLSFDALRKNLNSINAWILVIDTKGVNVWCAAGKGTFATTNLVTSIKESSLELIVKNRRIIVPQLGATGVAAHKIKELTGFRVIFGPVQASDIPAFVQAGYKATQQMRKIDFPFYERMKLIPVDFMYGKNKLSVALMVLFILSGLDKTGFLFSKMIDTSLFPLLNIGTAYLAGIVLTPLFLPWITFRAFALKCAFWGFVVSLILYLLYPVSITEGLGLGLINISIAAFIAMNFTGSSTYTSLSGVKKEMKIAIPFQIAFTAAGLILFIVSKLI
jgi:acetyl-CoA decarbonylase/synthase complex subunit gamma